MNVKALLQQVADGAVPPDEAFPVAQKYPDPHKTGQEQKPKTEKFAFSYFFLYRKYWTPISAV